MGISLVITLACLFTSGRVYWVLSMGHIHRTRHLAHLVLLSVISSYHSSVTLSALTIYQYIQYSVSACYKFVIASSLLKNQHITFRLLYLFLCFFSYVLFQLYSILHAQYLSGIDACVRCIFSWCRFRFLASRLHIDKFPISSSADLVVSPHNPRKIVISFITVFSILVLVFSRFSLCLSHYF